MDETLLEELKNLIKKFKNNGLDLLEFIKAQISEKKVDNIKESFLDKIDKNTKR